MQPRIMITNGGPHPAEKHADMTAWKIVDLIRVSDEPVDPKLPEDDRAAIEARREDVRQLKNLLEPKIAAALIKHHKAAKDAPKDHDDADGALADVNPILAATTLAAHFAKPEAQDRLREILTHDFSHAMHVERAYRKRAVA